MRDITLWLQIHVVFGVARGQKQSFEVRHYNIHILLVNELSPQMDFGRLWLSVEIT